MHNVSNTRYYYFLGAFSFIIYYMNNQFGSKEDSGFENLNQSGGMSKDDQSRNNSSNRNKKQQGGDSKAANYELRRLKTELRKLKEDRGDSGKRSNSNAFSTSNFSSSLICKKFTNSMLIAASYRSITDQTLVVGLKVKPIQERLNAQANVWARKIFSMDELYLKKILSSNDYKWISILEKAYIYSYFKAVLYALKDSVVAEMPDQTCFVAGHAILYNYLMKPSYTFKHDGFYITYNMRCSSEDLEVITTMANSYSFIKDYYSTGTRFYLENQDLDRVLDGLACNMKPDGPVFYRLSDQKAVSIHLTKDNFPFGNSFYSDKSELTDWYYCFNDKSSILDDGMLFGKACFIHSSDETDSSKFLDKMDQDDQYYLTKYEVSSLCGCMPPDYIYKADEVTDSK